jgi:energy-coupling factor transport system ATP-binding protein
MSIELQDVTYTYMPKTPFERTAMQQVSLTIEEGSITALAGHTGSGKSTLVQHLNGLLHPTEGKVLVDGIDIAARKSQAAQRARQSVGMVFQYPEHQLFEETVAADVAFGPKNFGLPVAEVEKRVKTALGFVDLDYGKYKDISPFQLSGGQMRRAAIAGVLALQPKYLVLDEPTAGLDPRGKEDLLQRIVSLHKKRGTTIVFVSHNMDDIARIADEVVVMEHGRLVMAAPPEQAFFAKDELRRAGLAAPQMVQLLEALRENGLPVDVEAFTVRDGVDHILQALRAGKREKGPSC